MKKIEINDQFKLAIKELESGSNIFITGKAGTGKSTLLTYFRDTTKKTIVTLAPTGIAAVNIHGETIHSFFKFKPGITLEEAKELGSKASKSGDLFKSIDIIIIDEISMVRADLLDAVDYFLRAALKNNLIFGGKQIVFFGDLYQLAPVARSEELKALTSIYTTIYFFSSNAVTQLITNNNLKIIELEKIYRQSDERFIKFLNKIRIGERDNETLKTLESQIINSNQNITDDYIYLTSRNDQADIINSVKLNQLKTESYKFQAYVNGEFQESSFPANTNLELKKGARVMFLNNDSAGRWVNGSLGFIENITKDKLKVKIDDVTDLVEVQQNIWELSKTVYNNKTKSLEREEIGSFSQIPLRLAWAITIHKSQGKTFEKVIIDLGKSAFALGQTYVALSRCKSLEGILMMRGLKYSDIRMDKKVSEFLTEFQYLITSKQQSSNEQIKQIENSIKDKAKINIVYLKGKNEESQRVIHPKKMGKMQYKGVEFLGLEAFCELAGEDRIFNIRRILRIDLI